eukprot:55364-Pelagomonas_calceolata.AAC.3
MAKDSGRLIYHCCHGQDELYELVRATSQSKLCLCCHGHVELYEQVRANFQSKLCLCRHGQDELYEQVRETNEEFPRQAGACKLNQTRLALWA